MADTKISALAAAATLADTDELVLASSGANKKITGANLKASMPAAPAAPLTLLSTTTLAAPGTFDVSGISQAYNDLIVIVIARDTAGSTPTSPQLILNNDTGANYYNERLSVASGAATPGEAAPAVNFGDTRLPATGALANSFGVNQFTLYGYASTVWLKTVNWESYALSGTSQQHMQRGSGLWNSTAAINRITFKGNNTGNLVVGSQLRIYGRL